MKRLLLLRGEAILYSVAIPLPDTGILTVDGVVSTIFSGVISDTGGLTKDGSSTLTLSGTNTYSGVTIVADGTLEVQNSSGLGTDPNTGTTNNTTINMDGTLTINGVNIDTEEIVLNGGTLHVVGTTATAGGTIMLMADSEIFTQNTSSTTGALTLSGAIRGDHGFNNTGRGTLTLSGINDYSGDTIVTNGELIVANSSGLGRANGTTLVNSAVLTIMDGVDIGTEGIVLFGTVFRVGTLRGIGSAAAGGTG